MRPSRPPNRSVRYVVVGHDEAGRRLDNFLLARLKGLPRSHLYKIIRKGSVRINRSRAKADCRLKAGDSVRIPPISLDNLAEKSFKPSSINWLNDCILFENDDVLVLNKPAGIPVHGGHGKHFSLIKALQCLRKHDDYLALAHRLDQNTSGCLIIAKHYRSLTALHKLLATQQIDKCYLALVKGRWPDVNEAHTVSIPLRRYELKSGERQVVADQAQGKPSKTVFYPLELFANATLIKAMPKTGRTHQIRVHASLAHHPVAGDNKYGDFSFNQTMKQLGLKRLFLHAQSVSFKLPWMEEKIEVTAPVDELLNSCLEKLRLTHE